MVMTRVAAFKIAVGIIVFISLETVFVISLTFSGGGPNGNDSAFAAGLFLGLAFWPVFCVPAVLAGRFATHDLTLLLVFLVLLISVWMTSILLRMCIC